jgi:hypothetical protein
LKQRYAALSLGGVMGRSSYSARNFFELVHVVLKVEMHFIALRKTQEIVRDFQVEASV